MGSRYGKTTPLLLAVIAGVALCVLAYIWFPRRGGQPTLPGDDGARTTTGTTTTAGAGADGGKGDQHLSDVEVFTEADAERLAVARARFEEVNRECGRIERELQGARYAALQSNPDYKQQLDRSQSLNREVAEMIANLPERKQLDIALDQSKSNQIKVVSRIGELEKQISDARTAHTAAVQSGEAPPVDESTMREWLTELEQRKNDARELKASVLAYFKNVKKLEIESKRSNPEISPKAVEAERIRRELNQAITEHAGVSELTARREALREEQKELVQECARLGSLSNRVAAAAQGES